MAELQDFAEMEKLGDLEFKQTRDALFDGIERECEELARRCAAAGSARSSGFIRSAADLVSRRLPALREAFVAAYISPLCESTLGVTDEGADWLRKKLEQVWLNAGADVRGMTQSLCRKTGFAAKDVHPAVEAVDIEFHKLGGRAREQIEIARLSSSRKRARPTPAAVRGNYAYHPEVQRVSGQLLSEGHFRQAVLDAYIHLIATVRAKTGLRHDGDDLMNRAFSPDNRIPVMRFNALKTQAEMDEQRGFWYLFKGIVGLRNYKAHGITAFDDPQRAHEYLALASLLFRLLDIGALQTERAETAIPEQ